MSTDGRTVLGQLIERGEYRVDELAVAEAMLDWGGSGVLVAAQPGHDPALGVHQHDAVAGLDVT